MSLHPTVSPDWAPLDCTQFCMWDSSATAQLSAAGSQQSARRGTPVGRRSIGSLFAVSPEICKDVTHRYQVRLQSKSGTCEKPSCAGNLRLKQAISRTLFGVAFDEAITASISDRQKPGWQAW